MVNGTVSCFAVCLFMGAYLYVVAGKILLAYIYALDGAATRQLQAAYDERRQCSETYLTSAETECCLLIISDTSL
jgi:hypothetical protein